MDCTILGMYVMGRTFLPDGDASIDRPCPVSLCLGEDGLCVQKHLTMRDLQSLTEADSEQFLYDSLFFEYEKIRELKTRKLFRERFLSFRYEGRSYYFQYLSDPEGSRGRSAVRRFLSELEQRITQ